jgi:hypothetical protein
MQLLEMARKTRKIRKSRQRGGGDPGRRNRLTAALLNSVPLEGKQKPNPTNFRLFPSSFVIDYILSDAADADTRIAITEFCKQNPTACNLCTTRYKNSENLLFMAVKKNKTETAKFLLSATPFNPECLMDKSSSSTKFQKNVLTLLVEDGYCGNDARIFENVANNDYIYDIIIDILTSNITPSNKAQYITFLDHLNTFRENKKIREININDRLVMLPKKNKNGSSDVQAGQTGMLLGSIIAGI